MDVAGSDGKSDPHGSAVAILRHLREVWRVISELENTLRKLSITPSKALGQNFLTDANVSAWIVDQLRPVITRYAQEREAGEKFGDFVVRAGIVNETVHGREFHDGLGEV